MKIINPNGKLYFMLYHLFVDKLCNDIHCDINFVPYFQQPNM